MKHLFLFSTLFLAVSLSSLFAQMGYSSASLSMSQERAARKAIPTPEEIVLEEYINYHTHQIPLPNGAKNVALDLQWNHTLQLPDQEAHLIDRNTGAILQIGLSTKRNIASHDLPPINVSLVIDRSGSMSGDRITKTKESMRAFVKKLRPKDQISIVTFDHIARVVLPAQKVGNAQKIHQIIQSIETGGSTNLEQGLILGYQELVKNYKAQHSNRIILLTDAITNTGVVNPHQIIQNSNVYRSDCAIDFALIGVGVDFNHALSRQLKESKRGQIHFVNSAEDIQKVFIKEVESLLMPVGKKVKLWVEYGAGVELSEIYGYQPDIPIGGNSFSIDLDDMNVGLTQVVLVKFHQRGATQEGFPIKVRLEYNDVQQNEPALLSANTFLTPFSVRQVGNTEMMFTNAEVQKNYTIAEMAKNLKNMAQLYQQGQPLKASQVITQTVRNVKTTYPQLEDVDIQRMLDILEQYNAQVQELSFSR